MQPKPGIESLKVSPHGGLNYAELEALGLDPEKVLDFSSCLNPFGPPPEVKDALNLTDISHYPDSEAAELRRCLAKRLKIKEENVIFGNGSIELIRLIAMAYLRPEDPALVIEPTFGEYEVSCQIVGSKVLKQRAREDNGFKLKVEETLKLIRQNHPKLIFLCNPDNPTGQYLTKQEVMEILAAAKESLLVLDEAYISFVENPWPSLDLTGEGNLIVLRSLTKDFALAGLRLGYAVAHQEVINTLQKVCPPWNVNAVAQKLGAIALRNEGYLAEIKPKIQEAKGFLERELRLLGFKTVPSEANFFLVKVGEAKNFRAALLQKGILVRDCTFFGLPEYIRIAPRTIPECQILINAIKKEFKNGNIGRGSL